MATRTWSQVFESVGLQWCSWCALPDSTHERGTVVNDVIHFRDRKITRVGIYSVLRQIAWQQDTEKWPAWRQIYLTNRTVLEMARKAQVRLPRKAADLDRAQLRFQLSHYTNEDIRRMTPSEQLDFTRARRWAARS